LREYECMLILPADADEALVTTAVDRITKVISPSGGEVTGLDRWGRRRFAYELARQTEGYYVIVRFSADPATQQELDRALKLADEVIRHKVMVPPPQQAKQAKQAKAAASPASSEA
jgi:small subunit ribosomal protein S6